jgi:hypothetical protein
MIETNMDYTQSYLRDRWKEKLIITFGTLNQKITVGTLNQKITLGTLNQKITLGTLNQKVTLGTLNQKIVEAEVKSISIGHIYMTSNIVL